MDNNMVVFYKIKKLFSFAFYGGIFLCMVYLFKITNNFIEFGVKSLEFVFILFAVLAALFFVLLLISFVFNKILDFMK